MEIKDFPFKLYRHGESQFISPARLQEFLERRSDEMAKILRIHRNTLRQAPFSRKVQQRLREVVRVLSAIHEQVQDVEKTAFYFINMPVPELGHRMPFEIIEADKTEELLKFLLSHKGENDVLRQKHG